MAVVGGVSHVWGAILGAMILTVLQDYLQTLLPKLIGANGNFEIIVFGVVMVLLLQYARQGVWPFVARIFPRGPRAHVPDHKEPLPQRSKPATGERLLVVEKARKQFGGLVAVNDVSFEVKASEIIGLIGPNGAGKSTTFNLVTGVLQATGGAISFHGERIEKLTSREIVKRGIGRTFQHVKMLPGMTVLGNVAIGAHLRGTTGVWRSIARLNAPEEARRMSEAAKQIKRVGLEKHIYSEAGSLALGQQRILEIARALCCDPTLLLLDEPAAGLRYQEKLQLADLLRRLRAEGMSILLVEHDMDFVMNLTDRLVVMEFGTKIAEGLPKDVQKDPASARSISGRGGIMTMKSNAVTSLILEVEGLSVRYGKVEALHDGKLTVGAGQIVSVIGPNGAGKLTLLNAIMGALPQTGHAKGIVRYLSEDVSALAIERRVSRGMCLVPEKRELFATMTVEDNLVLGAYRRKRAGKRNYLDQLEHVFRLFPRLKERRKQAAGTLSGDERQMLAVGRALMGKPQLLMLDEPSLGLAPLIVKEIFHIISALRQTGVVTLLIEQNARAALQISDYGYVLETG
ncbi:Branched-chain amino acid transport ATP-binding protein LivG [Candidatus Paraburkholderia schumanniana]|nr:Branched-chain amino acid transport ATP-binding protein LivG [Candidatus Paraburkholderia schumannianae]